MKLSTSRLLLAYATALGCFLLLDAGWLTLTSARIYRPALGHLMAAEVDWRAVAIFYPLYLIGLLVFAIKPALEQRKATAALWRGALLGFISYAAYDFTNQATLRDWPWSLTAIDLAWGTFVSAATAWAASLLTQLTFRPERRRPAQ